MSRIDLHVKVLDMHVVDRARRRGLDGIVFAPHFTRLPEIQQIAAEHSDDTVRVFPAREIFTGPWWTRRHLLAIGLTEPVPDFLPLGVTFDELERQNATVLVPHPTFFSISLTAEENRAHRDRIDAIEVLNPKHLPQHTRRARALAVELDVPAFGSSYAHLPGTVGEMWTEFSAPVEDLDALTSAIRDGGIDRIDRRRGPAHLTRRVLEFSHLGWENSWQKFDRTVLGDREATHPENPAYPDRFREIAAY